MTKISMDKKYKTRDGRPVRIVCVDLKNPTHPVLALVMNASEETIITCTKGGDYVGNHEHKLDLIEVSPYEDFKVDDPVMVPNSSGDFYPRHFAGISEREKPLFFPDGTTSWTHSQPPVEADFCRRPTPEELGELGEKDVPLPPI